MYMVRTFFFQKKELIPISKSWNNLVTQAKIGEKMVTWWGKGLPDEKKKTVTQRKNHVTFFYFARLARED